MMCFKDRTFCGSNCTAEECHRYFGAIEKAQAKQWWGGDGAPVAFSDFSKDCDDYTPPKKDKNDG